MRAIFSQFFLYSPYGNAISQTLYKSVRFSSTVTYLLRNMKCYIRKCFNYYPPEDKSISFFSFPVKSGKRDLWLKALPSYNWPESRCSKICSLHFAKSDILVHGKRKRLAANALPSINVEDEESSTCSGFGHEKEETLFKKTIQILENVFSPSSISIPQQTHEKHKPALEIELVPSSKSIPFPKDKKRKTPMEIEYPMSKDKRKTIRTEKGSLKWALETSDEDGINCVPILREKVEILRSFIMSRNLHHFEQ